MKLSRNKFKTNKKYFSTSTSLNVEPVAAGNREGQNAFRRLLENFMEDSSSKFTRNKDADLLLLTSSRVKAY